MKPWRWIRAGTAPALAVLVMWITIAYRDTLNAAQSRISTGSSIAQTQCGPIEYASRGQGPPILVVHGAGGGFDQGLMLGEPLPGL